jgi:hydrogenase maturation protease
MMDSKPSMLILGIGNPLRGDDGIGAHVCVQLEELNIPGISVQTTHQLHTEWIFTFQQYDAVLLVDASLSDHEVVIRPISTAAVSSSNLSHHMAASQIAALTSLIVGSSTLFFECAVPGDAFGLSDQLSEKGRMHADLAVASIKSWLEDFPSL